MSAKVENNNVGQGKPLEITKTFKAPRDVVFKYFTEGNKVRQWWGPNGFSSPEFKIDAKVGGKYLGCMRTPDAKDMWSTGSIIEIKAPEKLKYTDSFADKTGKVVPATFYGMNSEFPLECVVDLNFTEKSGETTLTLKHFGIPEADFKDCTKGWTESLEKLANLVEISTESDIKVSSSRSSTDARPSI